MRNPDFERQLDEFFQKALDLPPGDRRAYLQSVPKQYHARLQELIEASLEDDSQFLEPLSDVVADVSEQRFETQQRDLLFAILAWQAGLIRDDHVTDLIRLWLTDATQPLPDLSRQQRLLTTEQIDLLSPMVDAHIALHNGRTNDALANLSSVPGFVLKAIQDAPASELKEPLSIVGKSSGSDRTASHPDARQTQRRFQVLHKHASGGLGDVFVARDLELKRDVALKEIHRDGSGNEQLRSRFQREAEVTGQLEHPGIVPIYGLGQHSDGRPFYAMKFIEGQDLKAGLQAFHAAGLQSHSDRLLQLRTLLKRFVDVCEAVAFAHSRKILHRDLKPGNIMLGRYGETLVVDWGLACFLDPADNPETSAPGLKKDDDGPTLTDDTTLGQSKDINSATKAGAIIGTPRYMSPEQAAGNWGSVGPASDIYSLGAILYEILCGRSVVATEADDGSKRSVIDILQDVRNGHLRPVQAAQFSVPPALAAVCGKALSRDPTDRYQNAEDLARDIDNWLADEPVTAWKEPLRLRLHRWARRHQTVLAGIAATLLVATVAAFWVAQESRNATRKVLAEQQETQEALVAAGNMLAALDQSPLQRFRSSVDSPLTSSEKASVYQIADAIYSETPGFSFQNAQSREGLQAFFRALGLIAAQDSPKSREFLSLAAARLPNLRTVRILQAQARLNSGDLTDGNRLALSATADFPDDVHSWTTLANELLTRQAGEPVDEKRLNKIQVTLEQALAAAPGNPTARILQAELLWYQKNYRASEDILSKLLSQPELMRQEEILQARRQLIYALRSQKQFAAAISVSEQQVQENKATQHDYLYLAKNLMDAGRRNDAVLVFESLVRNYNTTLTGSEWNDLGVCYLRLGRFADAATTLRRALKQLQGSPTEPTVTVNAAVASVGAGDYEEAIRTLNAAKAIYPESWLDYYYCHLQQAHLLNKDDSAVIKIGSLFPADRIATEYGGLHIAMTHFACLRSGMSESEWPYAAEWIAFLKAEEVGKEGWDFQFLERFVQGIPVRQQMIAVQILDELKSKVRAK